MNRVVVIVLLTVAFDLLTACDEGESVRDSAPTPTNSAAAAVSPSSSLAHYSNESLKVELDYPAGWAPVSGYELGGQPGRFADPRGEAYGFFHVNALGGEGWTLDQAATDDAGHKLKPYGEHPQISTLNLPAGEARLITPDPTFPDLQTAEVIIRYETPLSAYSQSGLIVPVYNFFLLYAHIDDVDAIGESVRLVGN